MNLSNSLSYEQKKRIVENRLKPGGFFYLFCNFKKDPCNKYLVLACSSNNNPRFFIINTEIPHFIKKKQILLDAQVKLDARGYRFLQYDSYLNCSRLLDIFTKDNIIKQIIKDNTRLLPQRISAQTRSAILERVNSSKTIEKGNIDKINAQL